MTEVDWPRVQARLGVPVDGAPGALTVRALLTHVANRSLGDRGRALGAALAARYGVYGVATPLRLANFAAQTCHESGRFLYLAELWGPTPAQRGYEGRADLGNLHPGDGRRYAGRGLIQITGRANYRAAGTRLGIDLEGQPQLAEQPEVAVLTALDWWKAHNCNALADADDATGLSRLINRGSAHAIRPANGEAERIALTQHAKGLLA